MQPIFSGAAVDLLVGNSFQTVAVELEIGGGGCGELYGQNLMTSTAECGAGLWPKC